MPDPINYPRVNFLKLGQLIAVSESNVNILHRDTCTTQSIRSQCPSFKKTIFLDRKNYTLIHGNFIFTELFNEDVWLFFNYTYMYMSWGFLTFNLEQLKVVTWWCRRRSGGGLNMGPNNLCCVMHHFLLLVSASHVIFYKNFISSCHFL